MFITREEKFKIIASEITLRLETLLNDTLPSIEGEIQDLKEALILIQADALDIVIPESDPSKPYKPKE